MNRIVQLACLISSNSPLLRIESALRILQHLLLHFYARSDLRPTFRNMLNKHLHRVLHSGKVSGQDGGHERIHVKYFLTVYKQILTGTPRKLDFYLAILHPLHSPNEMVAWRDQVPVLQSYHEELVRCVLQLVDRRSDNESLLSEVLSNLLALWPDKFHTNTPKQVLLLHEIEMLVERCTVRELQCVEQAFVVCITLCA
jgi:hypothetical protein